MSPDQETGKKLHITHQSLGANTVRGQLDMLRGQGEYLVKQVPSNVNDAFLIELEGSVNSLYSDLDKELTSGSKKFRTKSLEALMKMVDADILPVLSEWSDFVKKNPNGPRPRELFKNMKSIAGKIRDLHKKI